MRVPVPLLGPLCFCVLAAAASSGAHRVASVFLELPCQEATDACFEQLERELMPQFGGLGCGFETAVRGGPSTLRVEAAPEGSACSRAGLEAGDFVLFVAGISWVEELPNQEDWMRMLQFSKLKAGVTVSLVRWSVRSSRREEVKVTTQPIREAKRRPRLHVILDRTDPELGAAYRRFVERRGGSVNLPAENSDARPTHTKRSSNSPVHRPDPLALLGAGRAEVSSTSQAPLRQHFSASARTRHEPRVRLLGDPSGPNSTSRAERRRRTKGG